MEKNKTKKRIAGVLVLLIVIGSITAYFWLRDDSTLYGEVEADIYPQNTEVAGKIMKMSVDLGDPVEKNDVIAKIDSSDAKHELEQLKLSKEVLEESPTADTDAGELEIEKIEDQISYTERIIKKYTIKANCPGKIMSMDFVIDDVVMAGDQIMSISNDKEKHFVFYLPKDDVNNIEANDELIIKSDEDEEEYVGKVVYIDVKSQYTPKEYQTVANKNKNSVKVKLLLPEDCPLKPGGSGTVKLS